MYKLQAQPPHVHTHQDASIPSSASRDTKEPKAKRNRDREGRTRRGEGNPPETPHLRSPNASATMLRAAGRRILGAASGVGGVEAAPAAALAAGAARRGYHERVVDHYNNPRNVGSFDKDDADVGTGIVGAPACGDVMKLQIRVDEGSGRIVDARFKTFGCGSAIASSSVASEWVKGKQMEEVVAIKNTEIAKHLSLPPVKLHCSMLAEDAIKAAVKDYEAKKGKLANADE
ncbi:hypothetical protein HU200_026449 [Digitaria exilis]|uniref:Iron-sulfur cluster assembly protein n=1 Tax=Digitaria exilis TaxID=1010633 RepID=A0A835C8Y3_9POAL|nr:hypothetical protein HU200_026449 [Digitaria exilis]